MKQNELEVDESTEPAVQVAERYSVKLPSGARYTLCAPASAGDVASLFPRTHYRDRRSFNSEGRLRKRLVQGES